MPVLTCRSSIENLNQKLNRFCCRWATRGRSQLGCQLRTRNVLALTLTLLAYQLGSKRRSWPGCWLGTSQDSVVVVGWVSMAETQSWWERERELSALGALEPMPSFGDSTVLTENIKVGLFKRQPQDIRVAPQIDLGFRECRIRTGR